MNRVGLTSISLVGALWALGAHAQPLPPAPPPATPPPPAPAAPAPAAPAPGGAPAPAAPPPGAAPAPAAPAPAAPAPAPAPAASASADAQGTLDFGGGEADAALGLDGVAPEPSDYERNWRKSSLHVQNAISGSTGLLHVIEA